MVSQLAYTGVGWQHRSLTEHLMHFGIIDWEDIQYTFSACGHLPSGIFDEPLNKMTEAWQDESLAKKSINAMIGIMSIDHNLLYTHKCSTLQDDAEEGCLTSQFTSREPVLFDFCQATRVLSNCSYRAVHDMCLSIEHAMVGKTL